jgi:hypothetical protein
MLVKFKLPLPNVATFFFLKKEVTGKKEVKGKKEGFRKNNKIVKS